MFSFPVNISVEIQRIPNKEIFCPQSNEIVKKFQRIGRPLKEISKEHILDGSIREIIILETCRDILNKFSRLGLKSSKEILYNWSIF